MNEHTVTRCPCCAYVHHASKVPQQKQRFDRGWVWLNQSVQGADGRWRAQPGVNLDDASEGQEILAIWAERCRKFLEWYEGEGS